MKYISLDIKTTGLDKETGQILQIACIAEDTDKDTPLEELPYLDVIIKADYIMGEPYGVNMNSNLIKIISEGKDSRLIDLKDFPTYFNDFLIKAGFEYHDCTHSRFIDSDWMLDIRTKLNDMPIKIPIAGKNVASFDIPWVDHHISEFKNYFKFHHRTLDVGSLLVDFKQDSWIPTLDECKKRLGIEGAVTHDALEDARDVIKVIRKYIEKCE